MAEFKTVYVVQGRATTDPNDVTPFSDAGYLPPFKTQYEAMVALEEMRKMASNASDPMLAALAAVGKLIKIKIESRIVKRTYSEEVVDEVHAQALGEK